MKHAEKLRLKHKKKRKLAQDAARYERQVQLAQEDLQLDEERHRWGDIKSLPMAEGVRMTCMCSCTFLLTVTLSWETITTLLAHTTAVKDGKHVPLELPRNTRQIQWQTEAGEALFMCEPSEHRRQFAMVVTTSMAKEWLADAHRAHFVAA